MTQNGKYDVLNLNQIYEMLLNQAVKIQKDRFKPDLIVGISRGGLVPARILSDLLEQATLASVRIEFYLGVNQKRFQPSETQGLTIPVTGKKVLLTDDVADSGESLKLAKTYLKAKGAGEVKVATLYLKPHSITTPDYFEAQTSHWIVFPWDIKETLRNIIKSADSKQAADKEVAKIVKAGLPKQLAQKFLSDMQEEA